MGDAWRHSDGRTARSSARAPPSIDLLLAVAYCLAHLVFFSTFANAIVPGLDRIALVVMALAVFAAIALAARRGHWAPVVLAAGVLVLIGWQLLVFSRLAETPVNWNAGLSYLPIAGFILFFNARRDIVPLIEFLAGLAIAYCAAYALLAAWAIGTQGVRILGGDSRGPRLMLANGYVALALFYCLVHIRFARNWWVWLAGLAAVALAQVEAQSRTFSAIVILIAGLALLGVPGERTRWTLAMIFTLLTAAVLAGAALPGWSVFQFMAWDPSGAARVTGYDALQPLRAQHPLTGIGLPPGREAFDLLVGEPYVYWEDLGAFGVWTAFGVAGLLAFLAIAYRCLFGVATSDPYRQAVSLAALAAAFFGVVSPSLWSGSSSVVANIVVALWLADRHATLPVMDGDHVV